MIETKMEFPQEVNAEITKQDMEAAFQARKDKVAQSSACVITQVFKRLFPGAVVVTGCTYVKLQHESGNPVYDLDTVAQATIRAFDTECHVFSQSPFSQSLIRGEDVQLESNFILSAMVGRKFKAKW